MSIKKTSYSARAQIFGGVAGLAILVGGFGGWAMFAEISGAVISNGRIEVESNRQVVQHSDGGTVHTMLVSEGDLVDAGDALVRLDGSELQSRLHIIQGQLYELISRRGRMEAERDGEVKISFDAKLLAASEGRPEVVELMRGQERLHSARLISMERDVSQLQKRRDQIQDQIVGIDAQQVSLEDQLRLIQSELRDQQTLLDKGLAQASRITSLQRERARLSGSVGALAAEKAQARGKMTEIDIEISKLETLRRERAITELREQQYRELELLEQERATADMLLRLTITAPTAGVVYNMAAINAGAVIRPADPILYIVPQDRPLIIAANVDAAHVDEVRVGQETVLRLPSLNQRTTPELKGRVLKLSADAFVDEGTGASYYKAEIVMLPGERDKLSKEAELLPGMPVDSYITTESRTPMAYFLKPLSDYFVKAFRE